MRAYHRGIVVAVVVSLGLGVAGCESMPDLENIFNTKKRLPGERKEVFPGGVPGVTQGVPQEMMKGNQPVASADGTTPAPVEAAPPPPPPEEKPKPKPKPRVAAKPKPAPAPAAASAPAQPQQSQPAAAARWPAPAAQSSKPAGGSVWPDPPPAGTFSR
jgi:outer membrane biosynthesis protein TonB